jgi:cobalamin biosynthetic protein CobC
MLEHGGNLRDAARRFGRPVEQWLDLSAGLNPHWYPVPQLAGNAWHRLPEADPVLAQAAADYYGAPAMLPVAGTQAAIQALPRLRPPSRVVVAAPSYAEHAYHWSQHGHSMHEVTYDALEAALPDCDVLVVCNPNNPTGAFVPAGHLLRWREHLAARGGWLVVDEAFGDTGTESIAAHADLPGLIVLRSVGKFFGLAGLRLGFVAADAELRESLADLLGPWTISGPAQSIALAALCDRDWQASMRTRLTKDSDRMRSLLIGHGITAKGCALFQWWPEPQAEAFWQHMAEHGIWVRIFRQAARGIRLGLPPDEIGWQRLALALQEWKEER